MQGTTLADVNAEIAAAGAMQSSPGAIPASIKANNLGMVGVSVQSDASGKECEFQVSLELYEDLDEVSLEAYLADAARRNCTSVRPGARFRIFQLPDSY